MEKNDERPNFTDFINEDESNLIRQPLVHLKTPNRAFQISERTNTLSKGIENLYTMRRLKSLEGSRMQQLHVNQWLEEDKKFLNKIITTEDISLFASGDLELHEVYSEWFLKVSKIYLT